MNVVQPAAPAQTGRDSDRIHIPPLGSYGEYASWRYAAMTNILASCARQAEAMTYILEIDNPQLSDQQLVLGRTQYQTMIDARVFSAIVGMLASKAGSDDSSRLLTRIRQACTFGSGRQAFRVIDGDFLREGPRRRQRALQELHALKPPANQGEIEAHLVTVEKLLLELRGTPDEPSEALMLATLRTLYGGQPRLNAVFAQHDLLGGGAYPLVQAIKTICVDLREQRNAKSKQQQQQQSPKAGGAVDKGTRKGDKGDKGAKGGGKTDKGRKGDKGARKGDQQGRKSQGRSWWQTPESTSWEWLALYFL